MRINKFLALATGISRRAADAAVQAGKVTVNGSAAELGQTVSEADEIMFDGRRLDFEAASRGPHTTIMLNKPVGYVVSRDGQGSLTVYDLLPPEYHNLKPVGRLDKNSSGVLLLTDDGQLAHELTHPSKQKIKIYEIALDKPLEPLHRQMIHDHGIQLDDGRSQLQLERLHDGDDDQWRITMSEGRNRQIRRTFAALGYEVTGLHRIQFGDYFLHGLEPGKFQKL